VESAPTTGYCSGCRAERRLTFAGYAGDGSENGVRPRAFYRSCESCATLLLVLADVTDGMGLVRNAIADWKRATGADVHAAANPALRTIDYDDLAGELLLVLWRLYNEWLPGRITFTSYASGLLPRRISSYVRDAVGSDTLYRSNGRGLVRVWPKAHATSVCISLEGATTDAGGGKTGDPHPDDTHSRADRLASSVGAVTGDFADNRSPDLGRMLARRGR
jgi:hypothetical protein